MIEYARCILTPIVTIVKIFNGMNFNVLIASNAKGIISALSFKYIK